MVGILPDQLHLRLLVRHRLVLLGVALAEMCAEGEDGEDGEGEKIFEVVRLGALSKQKDGRQKFEIECSRRMEEE